jgi:hypothetical protein
MSTGNDLGPQCSRNLSIINRRNCGNFFCFAHESENCLFQHLFTLKHEKKNEVLSLGRSKQTMYGEAIEEFKLHLQVMYGFNSFANYDEVVSA